MCLHSTERTPGRTDVDKWAHAWEEFERQKFLLQRTLCEYNKVPLPGKTIFSVGNQIVVQQTGKPLSYEEVIHYATIPSRLAVAAPDLY